ncbi:MAG: zinc carboxypeptidase [Bdellovibrio sp.]|nr:zinc carboxypeptidase [Bdellovibrio sp.]
MLWRPFLLVLFLFLASYAFSNIGRADSGSDFFAPWEPEREIVARVHFYDYHLSMLDFHHHDFEVLGVDLKNKTIDLYLSSEELQTVRRSGYQLTVVEEKNLMLAPDAQYKTAQEIAAFLQQVNQRFPEITKLESIGKSVEGRDIWALKISDNASINEPEESKIFFNGMHHAREVMTPEIMIDLIEKLTQGYGSDDTITNWVESNEVWVVPMLNVDGNNRVWTSNSMWRKNVAYGQGVDINRNYPYKWGSCNGSSGSTWSDTYRGPAAGSELETKAVMELVSRTRPVFSISYHSYSELVIYPYGCDGVRTETRAVVEPIGTEIGRLLGYSPGTAWELLYSVDGGDIDWLYGQYQVLPYVIEVNASSEGFQPNYAKWRDKTVAKNRAGWRYLLERLSGSGLKGQVRGASEQELAQGEVTLKVFIVQEGKRTLFQNYRVNPDGSFHIILNPGTIDVEVMRAGRSGPTHAGLVIGNGRLDMDISL